MIELTVSRVDPAVLAAELDGLKLSDEAKAARDRGELPPELSPSRDVYEVEVQTTDDVHKHRIEQADGRWWPSGIMTETPTGAETPEAAIDLVRNHYQREANYAAWQEYMRRNPPPEV